MAGTSGACLEQG